MQTRLSESQKICLKCGYQSSKVFQNAECNHCFCKNCVLEVAASNSQPSIKCLKQSYDELFWGRYETDVSKEQRGLTEYPGKEQQQQQQSQIQTKGQQFNSTIQSSWKSKKYQSPNEMNYEQRQQLFQEMKMDHQRTLNYCAVCLFYIDELDLKTQKQITGTSQILYCKIHTLCSLCIMKYYSYGKREYFCEICERLNK